MRVRAPPGGAARLGNQKATQWATGTATLKRYKNELGAALKPTSTQATQGNREATQTRRTKRSAEGRPEDADQATRAATGDLAGHPSRHTTTPKLWTRSTGARPRTHRQPDKVSRARRTKISLNNVTKDGRPQARTSRRMGHQRGYQLGNTNGNPKSVTSKKQHGDQSTRATEQATRAARYVPEVSTTCMAVRQDVQTATQRKGRPEGQPKRKKKPN